MMMIQSVGDHIVKQNTKAKVGQGSNVMGNRTDPYRQHLFQVIWSNLADLFFGLLKGEIT